MLYISVTLESSECVAPFTCHAYVREGGHVLYKD